MFSGKRKVILLVPYLVSVSIILTPIRRIWANQCSSAITADPSPSDKFASQAGESSKSSTSPLTVFIRRATPQPDFRGYEVSIEERLKTSAVAQVTRFIHDIRRPAVFKVRLADGTKAIFKLRGKKEEMAAYRIDRILGLGIVPPTTPRTVNGMRGVLQYYLGTAISLNRTGLDWVKPNKKIRFLDLLIHNNDRNDPFTWNPGNYLLRWDGSQAAIDHELAFGTQENTLARKWLTAQLRININIFDPGMEVIQNLQNLTLETLRNELSEYIDDEQIRAIWYSRDLFLDEYYKQHRPPVTDN